MRALWIVALVAGCDFSTTITSTVDAPPVDMPPDLPPGEMRTRMGLCAIWLFNETTGAFAYDTSPNPAVQLEIMDAPGNNVYPATFQSGELVASMPARVVSAEGTRLGDCENSGAITLEAWVQSGNAMQGSTAEPAFVAGLSFNATLRNIAILQAGTKWQGMVRTSAALDGSPAFVSTADVSTSMTHIAIVADGTRRTMYVDNAPINIGTPAPTANWDPTYAMVLFDEYNHGRQWTGRFSLIALFSRALTAQEVQKHWVLGPNAP